MRDMIVVTGTLALAALGSAVIGSVPTGTRSAHRHHLATQALTPEQLRAAMKAEMMVKRLEEEADMIDAEQLACNGEWRFSGSAEHPAYTLLINKLSYTVQPDHGSPSFGSVQASDATTALLIGDDPLARTGVEQHFIECRTTRAIVSGRHDKDAMLERVAP